MKKINIIKINADAPRDVLYCRYPYQSAPQPVLVYLDTDTGSLSINFNPEIGSAVTEAEWRGTILSFRVHGIPTAEYANDILEEFSLTAQKILDADDDESASRDLIMDAQVRGIYCCEDGALSEWDASEYFELCADEVLGLSTTTSPDSLTNIAEKLVDDALSDNILLDTNDVINHLRARLDAKNGN